MEVVFNLRRAEKLLSAVAVVAGIVKKILSGLATSLSMTLTLFKTSVSVVHL